MANGLYRLCRWLLVGCEAMTAKSFTGSRDDLRAKIKDMRAAGDSASVIGLALGISRCAVLGHVSRMGLPALPRRVYATTHRTAPPKPEPVPVAPEAAGEPAAASLRVSIMELSNKTCRWPSGDAPNLTYCGRLPHTASPYCEFHSRKAWSKPHAATQIKGRSTVQFHR